MSRTVEKQIAAIGQTFGLKAYEERHEIGPSLGEAGGVEHGGNVAAGEGNVVQRDGDEPFGPRPVGRGIAQAFYQRKITVHGRSSTVSRCAIAVTV